MIHGRLKALPAHVHHETTPVPGPWSSRVRRPLFKQRRERYRYRSLIYKLPVFRWSGATARYSCFRVPVETGTPPRRHKVCSAPFPPGGESFAGSLAPPHRTGPACAGLRFGWRLRRRAEYLARHSLRARIAAFLLDAAADAGGNTFSLGMRREDLAAYLGANRSALCRELSRLRAEGWIDCCRDSVRLINTAALAKSAAAENRSGEK